jgi:hypothetical protein
LLDGNLRSRNDPQNCHPKDVAAPGVIDARVHAHDRVRLYFRPKTPTQWHIEGIRKAGECSYGDCTHAAVLFMFVVDSKAVLTLPDVSFSDQNMQLASTQPGTDETYFSNIPFEKVFSEGGTGGDRTYTDARCAEVLSTSPLDLHSHLKAIYCRSDPERETLMYLLGDNRRKWEKLCHVSDALKVFQKNYTFVQELRLTNDGVIFRLNPRGDCKKVSLKITVWDNLGTIIAGFFNDDHAPQPNPPHLNWIWKQNFPDGLYKIEIKLENNLAYLCELMLGNTLF